MSTFKNPVGPQSPKVYWRRRLVVGLGLLAVIIVVMLIIFRPGANASNDDKKTPETQSTTAPTDAPAAQEEGAACNPANVVVTAVTDKTTYQTGENPLIGMSITNNGDVACTINAGTTQQVYEITSGAESYWKSTDCQSKPVDVAALLEPGVAQATEPFAWDRTRSDPATCEGERPAVTAGGASYHLKVSLGELEAANSAQFLLY